MATPVEHPAGSRAVHDRRIRRQADAHRADRDRISRRGVQPAEPAGLRQPGEYHWSWQRGKDFELVAIHPNAAAAIRAQGEILTRRVEPGVARHASGDAIASRATSVIVPAYSGVWRATPARRALANVSMSRDERIAARLIAAINSLIPASCTTSIDAGCLEVAIDGDWWVSIDLAVAEGVPDHEAVLAFNVLDHDPGRDVRSSTQPWPPASEPTSCRNLRLRSVGAARGLVNS